MDLKYLFPFDKHFFDDNKFYQLTRALINGEKLSESDQNAVLTKLFEKYEKNKHLPDQFVRYLISQKKLAECIVDFLLQNDKIKLLEQILEDNIKLIEDRIQYLLKNQDIHDTKKETETLQFLKPYLPLEIASLSDALFEVEEQEKPLKTFVEQSNQLFRKTPTEIEKEKAEQELKLSKKIKYLLKIANILDQKKLYKQADMITQKIQYSEINNITRIKK